MSNVFEVSGRGLSRVAGAGKDLPEPTVLLDLTAKPGDTWKAADGSMTLGKEEEVEVTAGKFRAIPVTSDSTRAGQTVKVTSRYAPKIGMVKSEAVINGITTTHVLKSFTSGK